MNEKEDIGYLLEKEELTVASISKRSTAYIIDELFLSLLILAGLWDRISTAANVEKTIEALGSATLLVLCAKLVYHAFFIRFYGSTLGKMVVRIRVIDISTIDNPSLATALLRSAVRLLGESIFYLGFLPAFFDPFRQTIHDKMAKTLVVDAT